jgi:hypothetical protein
MENFLYFWASGSWRMDCISYQFAASQIQHLCCDKIYDLFEPFTFVVSMDLNFLSKRCEWTLKQVFILLDFLSEVLGVEKESVGRMFVRTTGEACSIFGSRKCWKHNNIACCLCLPFTHKVAPWILFMHESLSHTLPDALQFWFPFPSHNITWPLQSLHTTKSLIHYCAPAGCSCLSSDYGRWFICFQNMFIRIIET